VRLFLDTNVLVSALTTRGLCSEILETVIDSHELLISEALLEDMKH
jgi:predicted nucleic acid-binding protein